MCYTNTFIYIYIYVYILHPGVNRGRYFEEGSLRGEIAQIRETRVRRTQHHPLAFEKLPLCSL